MDYTDGEGDVSLIVESENINRGSDIEDEHAEDEHKPTEKRLSAAETSWDICPFGNGGDELEETGHGTTQGNSTPLRSAGWIGFFRLNVIVHQQGRRVVSRIVPKHGYVNDPDTIKVGGHVEPGSSFFVGFEEDFLPLDLTEFEESLAGRDVDEASFISQDDSFDTLRIPKQLVDIVVSNNIIVIFFSSNIFALENFVSLISDVQVNWSDDIVEIVTFLERLVARLTFGRTKIVVATFEDEAETFRNETDLICFTPTTQIQSELPCTIMLRHLIHL